MNTKEQTDSVSAIKKEAKKLQNKLKEIQIEKRKLAYRLHGIRKQCPHDEDYIYPRIGPMNNITNNRNVECTICGEIIGKYCTEAEDHICKYPVPFEEADYHDKCTECGRLLEDP